MAKLINNLVVGMNWRPIVVQGDALKVARRKAQEDGASWLLFMQREQQVGTAALPKGAKPPKGQRWYSAARIAGLLYPNGYHFLLVNCDGGVWVCGLVDGVPRYPFDAILDEIEAAKYLRNFREIVALETEGDAAVTVHGDAKIRVDELNPISWDEIASNTDDLAMLSPLRPSLWSALPAPAKVGLGALVVFMAFSQAKSYYNQVQAQKRAAEEALSAVDPVQEWRAVYNKWVGTVPPVGPGVLNAWRDAMTRIPLVIKGWALVRVECKLSIDKWMCSATYDRNANRHADPTLIDFEENKPAGWIVEAKTLDVLNATFEAPVQASRLQIEKLPTIKQFMDREFSIIQRTSRAFGKVTPSSFTPAKVEPPRKPDGTALDQPVGMAKVASAAISIEGAMRSLDLEEIAELPIAWRLITLDVKESQGSIGINASRLVVAAQGDFYAKQ